MSVLQSEKRLENQESTGNQTNIHLWAASRKHKSQPSKDSLIAELSSLGIKKLELKVLSVSELQKLVETRKSGVRVNRPIPEGNRKIPYVEFLQELKLVGIEKCSVPTLKGLCESFHE